MKRIFLKGHEAGLSLTEISQWVNQPNMDPQTWSLKDGAPAKVAEIYPDFVEFMSSSDSPTAGSPSE